MLSTRDALRRLLRSDLLAGTLPIGRGGRIERKGYAEKLGITKSALTFYGDIFEEFEDLLGPALPSAVRHIPEMREFYVALRDSGALEVRDGRVSRGQILTKFGLNSRGGAMMKRYPEIRQMFLEFDRDVAECGYQPADVSRNLSKLAKLLSGGEFDDPDTGRIRTTDLRKAMGFSVGGNLPPPYSTIVAEHETLFVERLHADQLVFHRFERFFSLRFLVDIGWDFDRALRLKEIFVSTFDRFEDDRVEFVRLFNAARTMLTFLTSGTTPASRSLKSAAGRPADLAIPPDVLWRAVIDYQTRVLAGMNANTANGYVVYTNLLLDHLAQQQFFPHIGFTIGKYEIDRKTPRKTIAENRRTPTNSAEDAVAFVASVLVDDDDDARYFLDDQDTADFLFAIKDEFRSSTVLASGDIVATILAILTKRLKGLADHFWAIFEKWRQHYELGQELIAEGVDPKTYWCPEFIQNRTSEVRRRMFSNAPGDKRQTLANFLRLVRDVFGGRIPNRRHPDRRVVDFFRNRMRELGGVQHLAAYLRPHNDLVGALVGLYLNESGANVAVARTLLRSCIKETDEPGYKLVIGHKTRARGKPIVVYLREDGRCVRSLCWWGERVEAFLPGSDPSTAEYMFTLNLRGEVKPVPFTWLRDWYLDNARQIPGFEGSECLPSSIRPSVLLQSVLDHDGEIRHAITLAQHTEGVHGAYYDRFPVRFMHVAELRNFNRIKETIAIHRIPGGPAYLGLDDASLAARLDEFVATGLGTLCRDPCGHPNGDGAVCTALDCWQCPNAILIAEPPGIASLITWRTSLLEAEGDWVRDQPDRWERYFLPWISFADVVEEKMQTGELADIWDEASLLAQQTMAHPSFKPYRPWS